MIFSMNFFILVWLFIQVTKILETSSQQDEKGISNLESLKEIASAENGERRFAHCLLQLNRSNCDVNITAKNDCPVPKLIEKLFVNNDLAKITGGFINQRLLLTLLHISFSIQNSGCNWLNGTVELVMNSKNNHVRVIEDMYLPLRVYSLKVLWSLGIELLRSVDLQINGQFVSDSFGPLSPTIPRNDGVEVEITKLKGSTIFEMKTVNSKDIQLKHFLSGFNFKVDSIVSGLSDKTASKISLSTMLIEEGELIGYIEPNILFELQLTGLHIKDSEAFQDCQQFYITIQKYHNQDPSFSIFGKFEKSNGINNAIFVKDLMKLSTITNIPSFNFFKDIVNYGLVLSTDKVVVLNNKKSRDATNDFTCVECGARYFPGFYIVYNLDDIFNFLNSNDSSSDKKLNIPHMPLRNPVTSIVNQTFIHKRTKIIQKPQTKYGKINQHSYSNIHKMKELYSKNSRKIRKRSKISHHQHHFKRFKREDELKDILNSLNPGNLTMNDTVPGAFEIDDTFEFDENNKPTEALSADIDNNNLNMSVANNNTLTNSGGHNINASINQEFVKNMANSSSNEIIGKTSLNKPKASTTESPTKVLSSPHTTSPVIPATLPPKIQNSTTATTATTTQPLLETTSSMFEKKLTSINTFSMPSYQSTSKEKHIGIFKYQGNTNRLVIMIQITEYTLSFRFPQNIQGSILDITKFVSEDLKANSGCRPYGNFSTMPLYSINHLLLTNDKIELVLNLTQPIPLIPDLISISKYSGLIFTIDKDINEQFNFSKAIVSGQGKQTVIDQEFNFAVIKETNTCSCVSQLFITNIRNITKQFNADLLSKENIHLIPTVENLSLEKLFIKTDIVGDKTISMFGNLQFHSTPLNIEAHLLMKEKQRKLVLAIIGNQVPLISLLSVVYNGYLEKASWIPLEKGALLIGDEFPATINFREDLLSTDLVNKSGVTLIGDLALPTSCENDISTDRLCQYFIRKLRDFSGLRIHGIIYPDNFNLTGSFSDTIRLSNEIEFIKPSLILDVKSKSLEILVLGEVNIGNGKKTSHFQGSMTLYKCGYISLQIFGLLRNDIFTNPFLTFKRLYGISLSVNQKDDQVFEIQGSRVTLGRHGLEKSIPIINGVGELVPSNSKDSFYEGVIKDLSYIKLIEVFGQVTKMRQLPFLNEARFIGITKLRFHESQQDKNASQAIQLFGTLKISGNMHKTMISIDESNGIKLNIELPVLSMAKDLVVIRKSKEDQNIGATISYIIPLNTKQAITTSMVAYVSAFGFEKENVEVHVQQKSDSSFSFLFQLKGKMFNSLEMVLNFKAVDKASQTVKMVGQPVNIFALKFPIKRHLSKHFEWLSRLYSKNSKANENIIRETKEISQELESKDGSDDKVNTIEKQIIQVESDLNQNLRDINKDCVEKCSKNRMEIQTLQEEPINDGDLKSLRIQRITPRWSMNVSCVAFCEVDKGISYKKACEELTIIRNQYEDYKELIKKSNLNRQLVEIAKNIKERADTANDAFVKDGNIVNEIINKYWDESNNEDWFEFLNFQIPETDVGGLKGKIPCLKTKLKFRMYSKDVETTKDICFNDEVYKNVALRIFETVFGTTEFSKVLKSFDQLKASYSTITKQITKLRYLIDQSDFGEATELSVDSLIKRDELFTPVVSGKKKKEEDGYERKFKKLIGSDVPQYTVHSFKTSSAMNQKSPWALLKSAKNQVRSSAPRNVINGTVPEDNDCNAVNLVATKFAHLANVLTDLVEAYEEGKASFSNTRDELVDSLHLLDAKITNEANRTYYTKGELKDMIYWSVRVWKGVEEWVQESTRQFEEHNRNAISVFTEQLDSALSSERIPNAADYIQYLSRIGTSAIRKMEIERIRVVNVKSTNGVVKSNLVRNNFNVKKNNLLTSKRLVPIKSDPNYVLRRSNIRKRSRVVTRKNLNNNLNKKSFIDDKSSFAQKDLNNDEIIGDKKSDGLVYRQVDHVQNVAIALSTFLRNKDMTLDEAATRIPALRNEIRLLESKASTCDTPN